MKFSIAISLMLCATAYAGNEVGSFKPPLLQNLGGTGLDTSAVTNGQILIGNTTGNVFALGTIQGTSNQVAVANGASSIQLSVPAYFTTTTANFGTGAAGTSTTTGFVGTQGGAGVPTGVPANLLTGSVPLYVNTSNGVPYGYYGSAWNAIGTSISGTANQIDLSAATGAVTASLDAAIIFPGTVSGTSNTLPIRNGTNAQEVDNYNTFTSSTSYEDFYATWKLQANVFSMGTQYGSSGGSPRQWVLGGETTGTDVALPNDMITARDAYAQATTNTSGASLIVAGGIGSVFWTITTSGSTTGSTYTVTVNGVPTTYTDGTSFTHSTTNTVEATNLAAAVTASGVSAVAVSNIVYLTPLANTYTLICANSPASGTTATSTNKLSGGVLVPGVIGGMAVAGDSAPPSITILGWASYPQGSVNKIGGSVSLYGGLGSASWTIVTASALSGATFTVYVDGTPTIYTDGVSFTHSSVNNTEASNLAAAVTASGVSATAVGAVVYLTPAVGTYFLSCTTNAAGANATASSAGDPANIILNIGAKTGTGGDFTAKAGSGYSGGNGGNWSAVGGPGGLISGSGGSASITGGLGQGTTSGVGGVAKVFGGAGSPQSNNNANGGVQINPGAGSGNAVDTGIIYELSQTGASGAAAQTVTTVFGMFGNSTASGGVFQGTNVANIGWVSGTTVNGSTTPDTNISRIVAGGVGAGTGAQGNTGGAFIAVTFQGLDTTNGTSTTFRGGNGTAGVGGFATFEGGSGTGANKTDGGWTLSTNTSTGNAVDTGGTITGAPCVSGGASGSGINSLTTLATFLACQNNPGLATITTYYLCQLANVTFGDGGTTNSNAEPLYAVGITPTLNLTGATKAEKFTALLVNPTFTSKPTGTVNIVDFQSGGTSTFALDSFGDITYLPITQGASSAGGATSFKAAPGGSTSGGGGSMSATGGNGAGTSAGLGGGGNSTFGGGNGSTSGNNNADGGTTITTGTSSGNATDVGITLLCAPCVSGGASGAGSNAGTVVALFKAVQNNPGLATATAYTLCNIGNVTFTDGGTTNTNAEPLTCFSVTPTLSFTGATKNENFTGMLASVVTTNLPLGTLNVFDAQLGSSGLLSVLRVNISGNNTGTVDVWNGMPGTLSGTANELNIFGPNASTVTHGVLRNSLTLTGGATTNMTTVVPAHSVVYATSCRITTTITTATSWSFEDSNGNFYGATSSTLTSGTILSWGGCPTTTSGGATLASNYYQAANTFKIVASTTPGAGVMEVIIWYYTITGPTS